MSTTNNNHNIQNEQPMSNLSKIGDVINNKNNNKNITFPLTDD